MKAVVTGHTKGLGAALALDLLARNIPVLGLARGCSHELAARFPNLLTQVALDLADTATLANWLEGPALGGFLDACGTALLINNAGVVSPVGALHDQNALAVARAVSLNVAAPLMLAAAVVGATDGAQRRILHVSSGAARKAYPGWSIYCATKAALDHHARAVALDAARDVRICSLAPGVIDTDMQAQIRSTPAERFALRARFIDLYRAGQLSAPDECARRVIDYLLDERFGRNPVDDLRTT